MYRLVHADSDREYLRGPGDELQTDLGVLEVPDGVSPGDELETHLGASFAVRRLRGPDLLEHFERSGAPMLPRDVGLVIGHTGPAAGDRALDVGTGTGVLAASLGRLGLSVTTYERDAEAAETARANLALAGVADRVEVRTGDARDELDRLAEAPTPTAVAGEDDDGGEGFDLLTLDTGDAPALVARSPELLDRGGFLAVYAPFVEGSRAAVAAAREADLAEIETYETIQRRMRFDDRGSRPDTAGVGHTGYLTVARRP